MLITAVGAPTKPATFRLERGTCIVGAGAAVDFVVDDETVSRQHLALELVPEGLRIRDLGSRNGTFYNGHRVDSIVLGTGAVVSIGGVELQLRFDVQSLTSDDEQESYGEMVAASAAMRRLFGTLRRLEGSLVGVLLVGESGTGKELIARAIHQHSAVAPGPLVTLNCGVLQRELVRSELFGHRKGAFTGAIENRLGAFQRAHGGTLLLDEVGELPLEVQPVLLRALQEREVVRVGETQPEPVEVRLIAATHRDLEQMVAESTFREDLYYRLNVVRLQVPPLRERVEDIELLAKVVARRFGIHELSPSMVAQLKLHTWPGNVRELMHAIEAYAAVGELPLFNKRPLREFEKSLADHLDVTQPYDTLKQALIESFQIAYLRQLMTHTGGNVAKAARLSGLERSYLNKLVIQHGLRH